MSSHARHAEFITGAWEITTPREEITTPRETMAVRVLETVRKGHEDYDMATSGNAASAGVIEYNYTSEDTPRTHKENEEKERETFRAQRAIIASDHAAKNLITIGDKTLSEKDIHTYAHHQIKLEDSLRQRIESKLVVEGDHLIYNDFGRVVTRGERIQIENDTGQCLAGFDRTQIRVEADGTIINLEAEQAITQSETRIELMQDTLEALESGADVDALDPAIVQELYENVEATPVGVAPSDPAYQTQPAVPVAQATFKLDL